MNAQIKAEKHKLSQQKIHDDFFALCESFVSFKIIFFRTNPESQALFLKEFERSQAGEKDAFSVEKLQKV